MLNFTIWIAGAVMVVGIMQWAKNLFPNVKTKIWSIVLPVISIGVAILQAVKTGEYNPIPWNAAGIWAISQVGYELIIQTIENKISKS